MENIEDEIRILDYLQGYSNIAERKLIEDMRQLSPAFDAKFNEVKRVWEGLDLRTVPDTSPDVKSNFQAMLKTFELEHNKGSFWDGFFGMLKYKPQYNWAYAVLLVGFGALIGYLFLKPQNSSNNNLGIKLNDPKQNMVLTMLADSMATQRMKAVSYTQDLRNVNDRVIDALLITLNTDDNENVRLVTLEVLVKLADNPKVREGLIASIVQQDSELMKAALADAMLQLQEKKSMSSFKKILNDKHGETPIIRKKLEQTVKELETI